METRPTATRNKFLSRLKREAPYHVIILVAVAFVAVFSYVPMAGLVIAFKDYHFGSGIFGSPWVGLKNFRLLFSDFRMNNAIANTVGIFLLSTFISIPVTVLFALFLNEVKNVLFKRAVQTISYLPHFISWAIMAVLLDAMLSPSGGVLNNLLVYLGVFKEPVFFLGRADLFWGTVIGASMWKELGWSAIIYLAVITGIDENLYEAARIDGAGRLARMWHITLPSLRGIICIILIMSFGSMAGTAFAQAFFLRNSLNYDRANVLAYYVYEVGLRRMNFSYSTAIGLLLSLISMALMLTANKVVKMIEGRGLF